MLGLSLRRLISALGSVTNANVAAHPGENPKWREIGRWRKKAAFCDRKARNAKSAAHHEVMLWCRCDGVRFVQILIAPSSLRFGCLGLVCPGFIVSLSPAALASSGIFRSENSKPPYGGRANKRLECGRRAAPPSRSMKKAWPPLQVPGQRKGSQAMPFTAASG